MKNITPILRTYDKYGSGEFGAPRGKRTHNGIDFVIAPNQPVLALVAGTVTKIGYPYRDDLGYRYVEVTDCDGKKVRYFYVEPYVNVRDMIVVGDMLGTSQDIGKRYPGITPHLHFEVMVGKNYINPNEYLS